MGVPSGIWRLSPGSQPRTAVISVPLLVLLLRKTFRRMYEQHIHTTAASLYFILRYIFAYPHQHTSTPAHQLQSITPVLAVAIVTMIDGTQLWINSE